MSWDCLDLDEAENSRGLVAAGWCPSNTRVWYYRSHVIIEDTLQDKEAMLVYERLSATKHPSLIAKWVVSMNWNPLSILRQLKRPDVAFLFMDDTQSDEKCKPRISALTALLVPVRQYVKLRTQFYAALGHLVVPQPNHIAMPAELHGMKLPGNTDEEKIANATAVVDLVVRNRMKVFRVGYYITDQLQATMPHDKWLLGVCWNGILQVLEPVLARQMLIPVMDGFNSSTVRSFSSSVRWSNVLHAAGLGRDVSICHSEHVLTEVVYTNSEYSVFTQVVDIVAYLRKITDMENDGWPLPPFKQALLPLAHKVAKVLVSEDVIAMTFNGVPQGPKHMARKHTGKDPLVGRFQSSSSDSAEPDTSAS